MKNENRIQNIDGEARAGTFFVAEGFNRRHNKVSKLVEDYYELFCSMEKSFARTGAKVPTRKVRTRGRAVEEYLLNETQAIFLGTLFRTSAKKKDDPVLLFKLKLAKEFVALREQKLALKKHKGTETYQITRDISKLVRLQTTDAMKSFVEYSETQGSKNANMYYSNITRMVNGLMFIVDGKFKNLREVMSVKQLMTVSSAEQIVERGILDGISRKKYYKDIYQDVKRKVMMFAELHGQTEVIEQQLLLGEDKC